MTTWTPAYCYCGTRHRTWKTAIACAYPTARIRVADGPYLFVHTFNVHGLWRRHVSGYPTRAEADAAAAIPVPCSGTCSGHHRDYLPTASRRRKDL